MKNMKIEFDLYDEHIMPNHLFEELKKDLEDYRNNEIPKNKELAGNIKKEFQIVKIKKEIVNYLETCAKDFYVKDNKVDDNYLKLKLKSLWTNKQEKYEFNPLHKHGDDVSFVCWVKIPYDLNKELELNNCKNSLSKSNSLFEFVFSTFLGEIQSHQLKIDKSWEGTCIFFNSKLQHQVYPFYTSDDYRISVSGNFVAIKKEKNKKTSFNYQ